MKKILSLMTLAILGLSVLTACQTASTANMAGNIPPANTTPKADEHGHVDDAPRITLADAKKDFDAGSAIFVDTRAKAAYDNEHIKGSINMTTGDVEARYKELPIGKKIIAYCS